MPVTDVTTSPEDLTITITAEFAAPVERVWQVYADPRQLEKIWGPPGYPATFVDFDFRPGGRATYYMTGPGGEKYGGWFEYTSVTEPTGFEMDDGFADADLNPLDSMPVTQSIYSFAASGSGTRAVYRSLYASAEGLQQVLDMGVVEGSTEAINQIDDLLAG